MSTTEVTEVKAANPATGAAAPADKVSRKKKKDLGRKKRVLKLKTDKVFSKAYHEGKSKRAADKKSAFRKKKTKKK
jgi:hypothetical protein